ncbi:MAG: hypothetical protein ACE5HD_03560 [Acidobacteriota bacterium]
MGARLSEQVFRQSPRPLKDILCSLYGWGLNRRRYGGGVARRLQAVLAEERLSPEALEQLSLERLRRTLVRAGRDVPFYRRLFRQEGIDPATLPLPSGLEHIPILDKATVRSSPRQFLSRAVRPPLAVRETSGTTGSPLAVPVDLESLRLHYAYYERFRIWAGTHRARRRATFNGRVLWPAARHRPPFWVRDWAQDNTLFSVYHMSPATLPAYIRHLLRLQPEEIQAYPSALLTLARFALRTGQDLPRPRAILLSAETLVPEDRRLLRDAFHCPVFNQYGNAEMSIFAGDCRQGCLHLDTAYSYTEILGPDGRGGAATGEVITTGYMNRAMPLIRFRVGDTVSLGSGTCACGRPYPVLQKVVGRTDDLLILPDGRRVGRLDPVFKGMRGIDEVQIIQETPGRVVMKVVPGPGFAPDTGPALAGALAERLGPSVEILVRPVDAIARTSRGKFRAVVRRF